MPSKNNSVAQPNVKLIVQTLNLHIRLSPNVSTTPITAMGDENVYLLVLSEAKGKHCRLQIRWGLLTLKT